MTMLERGPSFCTATNNGHDRRPEGATITTILADNLDALPAF
jgi:hypothetical protein